MSSADPLAGLRDIHLPDAVPFWPPAPGWWVLAAILLLLGLVAFLRWRHWRAGVQRAARVELLAAERQYQSDRDARALAVRLSALVRRLALVRGPREELAGLHGAAWVTALAQLGGKRGFPECTALALERAVYSGAEVEGADADAWLADVRRWIGSRS